MSVKIKGIYFTLANEQGQRCRNGILLCFTVFMKGMGSSQAQCPRASVCPVRGGTSRRVEGKGLAPSELPVSPRGRVPTRVNSLMLIYFILSWMLLASFSPWVFKLVLLAAARSGWTCLGWKVWISQTSYFAQKCLN